MAWVGEILIGLGKALLLTQEAGLLPAARACSRYTATSHRWSSPVFIQIASKVSSPSRPVIMAQRLSPNAADGGFLPSNELFDERKKPRENSI